MEECILAVDGGGEGFRRAQIVGTTVGDIYETEPVNNADELLCFVRRGLTPETEGISYAMAGINEKHNKIIKSPSIHMLDKVALGDLTKEKLGKPAVVCNDMEASVMGMAALLPELSYFMGITWSSGIDPCQALDQAYDRREDWAMSIYDLVSTGMATFLAGIQSIFHLPAIVWKGTFAKNALPRIEQDIHMKMRSKLINPDWAGEMKFLFSPKPKEDGLIGAAQIFKTLMN